MAANKKYIVWYSVTAYSPAHNAFDPPEKQTKTYSMTFDEFSDARSFYDELTQEPSNTCHISASLSVIDNNKEYVLSLNDIFAAAPSN